MPGEDDGQGDFFQDGDEEEEEEELEMFDESIDRFELSGWRPDASAVTTWQAAVHAGAARLRMASKSFTRHPFLEHFVDVPVLQITDEVDAAVKGSGEGGGEEEGGRCGGEGGGGRGAVVLQMQLLGSAGGPLIKR